MDNGRKIKVLVVRLAWADFPNDPVVDLGDVQMHMNGTNLYYKDMSYGAMELEMTYPEPFVITAAECDAETCTAGGIRAVALARAEEAGYLWCGGICSIDPSREGDYDQFIMIWVDHNPENGYFAGLGVVGSPLTWSKYHTSDALLEHELGHNMGFSHGLWANVGREGHPGLARMEGGGYVRYTDESTRYVHNGQYGLYGQVHFGWIPAANVQSIHPQGASGCAGCVASGTFKLWAMDRPDVIPSAGQLFGLQLKYSPEGLLHIYYRSSNAISREGAVVVYTKYHVSGSDSGAGMTEYTEDVRGDTPEKDDMVILPGTTFVATPNYIVRQNAENDLSLVPRIRVDSVTDWSACTGYTCSDGDYSLTVTVDFVLPNEVTTLISLTTAEGSISDTIPLTDMQTAPVLFRVSDGSNAPSRPGGVGTFEMDMCATVKSHVYVYENYPHSALTTGSPVGYNAYAVHTVFPLSCCGSTGSPVVATGYMAIKVIQNEAQPLSVAEVAAPKVGGGSCMDGAKCYSYSADGTGGLRTQGSWASGAADGYETKANDGDFSTYSHTGSPFRAGDFFVCIFAEPCLPAEVTIYPRKGYLSRRRDLTVEMWKFAEYDTIMQNEPDRSMYSARAFPSVGGGPHLAALGETYSILEADWGTDANNVDFHTKAVTAPAFPETLACPYTSAPSPRQVPYTGGQAYVLVAPKDAQQSDTLTYTLSAFLTECTAGSYQQTGTSCSWCGERYLSRPPHTCGSQSCSIVQVDDPNGDITSTFILQPNLLNGAPWYKSTVQELRLYRPEIDSIAWRIAPTLDTSKPEDTTDIMYNKDTFDVQRLQGVRVVKLIQMDGTTPLNMRDIQIWSAEEPSVDLAPSATCYSWPAVGYWYNGDKATGEQAALNDNDDTTYSHSGNAAPGQPFFDMCVLPQPRSVTSIRAAPRQGWGGRAKQIKIELWDSFIPPSGECTWTENPDTYSGGYAGGDSTSSSLEDAKARCIALGATCKAVTCSPNGASCTIRASSSLGNSPSGETSHVPSSFCFGATGPDLSKDADLGSLLFSDTYDLSSRGGPSGFCSITLESGGPTAAPKLCVSAGNRAAVPLVMQLLVALLLLAICTMF